MTDFPTKIDEPTPGFARRSLRILLAEDNAVIRVATQHLLRRLGHRADGVANGREALEALDRHLYDVVLMDVQMPVMDGLEATRRLRFDRPEGRRPVIIALTANAGEEDREICLAAGMDELLSKPLRSGELAAVLGRCLEDYPTPEPLAVAGPAAS